RVKFEVNVNEASNLSLVDFGRVAEIEMSYNGSVVVNHDNCKANVKYLSMLETVVVPDKVCDLDFVATDDPIYNSINRSFNIKYLTTEYNSKDTLNERFQAAIAPALSFDWIGCEQWILNNFYTEKLEKSSSLNSLCYYDYGTIEYSTDPCCNITLSFTKCCSN